jgi:hypothetical protein
MHVKCEGHRPTQSASYDFRLDYNIPCMQYI